ncbi:hypothetical protein OU798_23385 [Prolixibacteraceae bacterium Z1-6]|uniref:DUF3157 family protein n=1 Tax=Draconibacterium aestuarii TaxID=2998507 RepID=A0A9X3J8A3_9BACT|nr:hypothetical protein [Prolixibacteraceae bacterium Z1-6]
MRRLFVLVSLIFFTQLSFAQVRATTETGNKVILFDNGTWKYEEKTVTQETPALTVVTIPSVPSVAVDSTREIETKPVSYLRLPSPILERYFGEEKGRIHCRLSCSNHLGDIQVNYSWEMPVGDGQRYFGSFKAGSKLTVHLLDGKKVELFAGEDSNVDARPKYNFTAIAGTTQPLSTAQIDALIVQPFRKLEVEWKKKTEVYEIEASDYFMENLPLVF